MLNVKIWNRFVHQVGDERISMEVKRLRYDEAAPLVLVLGRAWDARGEIPKDAPLDVKIEASRRFVEAIPAETIREAFTKWVRNVGGLETETGSSTEGAQLYEVADHDCVLGVMTELQRLSHLGAKEADFFGSPSTPSSTPEPVPSSSDAGSIGSEGGPLSTATEIPARPESSIAQA